MAESSFEEGGMKHLFSTIFRKTWPMRVGGILLGVGNICLFIVLKALSPGMKQKVFLSGEIGCGPAIIIFLVVILLWYLFVKWNERTGKFSAI